MTKKKSVLEILKEKSGHGFHSRVVKLLRKEEHKWDVLVSPYYSDNFTDKPREIDIIALKGFQIQHHSHTTSADLSVRLFIECKYINGKTIFWFDNKNRLNAIQRIKEDTNLENPKEHHYANEEAVGKLFTSEKSRGDENDMWAKAVNQNLNALIYYRERHNSLQDGQSIQRVSYPIIVCNSFDNLYRIDMGDEKEKISPIKEPFQLEVNYAYLDKDRKSRNEYFLIDVVSADELEAFLSQLESKDIQAIRVKMSFDEAMRRNAETARRNERQQNPGM